MTPANKITEPIVKMLIRTLPFRSELIWFFMVLMPQLFPVFAGCCLRLTQEAIPTKFQLGIRINFSV